MRQKNGILFDFVVSEIELLFDVQVLLNKLECREKVHFFLVSYFKK